MLAFRGARSTGEVQAAARALGLEVATKEIRRAEEIAPAFEAIRDRVTRFTSSSMRLEHQSHSHQHARAGRAAADESQ